MVVLVSFSKEFWRCRLSAEADSRIKALWFVYRDCALKKSSTTSICRRDAQLIECCRRWWSWLFQLKYCWKHNCCRRLLPCTSFARKFLARCLSIVLCICLYRRIDKYIYAMTSSIANVFEEGGIRFQVKTSRFHIWTAGSPMVTKKMTKLILSAADNGLFIMVAEPCLKRKCITHLPNETICAKAIVFSVVILNHINILKFLLFQLYTNS